MARVARVVVPGYPHHITQRGNRRQRTFFSVADYLAYFSLLVEAKIDSEVEFWAYCLMPNHVHFVAVPAHKNSLAELFQGAHRRYTRMVNSRNGWRGHLWQERFHSFVMDEPHLIAAIRYIELNPVRADLCPKPQDWRWSSVHAHLAGKNDALVTVKPMLQLFRDWSTYLDISEDNEYTDRIRLHTRTGRPAGSPLFLEQLENITGRNLKKLKPGPKKDK